MKNNEYWKNRFEQLEKARHERAKSDLAEIEKIFDESIKQLNKKIEIWYRRIAENNDVSMTEARKMLTKNQLKEFRWDVWEYIRSGQENALNRQWEKELENASAKAHITRLEALKIDSKAAIEELYTQYGEVVKTALSSVYSDTRLTTNYEISKGLNVLFNTAKVNRTTLEAVLSKPWVTDGFNFSERIWNSKEKLIKEVHKELTIDILQGRDPQKAIDSIAKKMNTSKYNAGRLVMTEEAYFASLAQKDELEYLGVEKYEILATLDDRTSDICQNLDGKVFDTKDYEPGTTAPPFHVYCRTTTVPYFDDDFGQIGERAARNHETGKTYYVPDDITYPEWKEKFVYKGLTISDNGGIIKENGISGKKVYNTKSNKVDLDYIQSKEYHQKFKSLPYNDKTNEQIYNLSKAMLTHRNGTDKEDMYLIELHSGAIVGKQTASKSVFGVDYNESLNNAYKNAERYTLVSLHNHPTENPPTGSDFSSMGYHRYHSGVVVCHNGNVYWYKTGDKAFMGESLDKRIERYRQQGVKDAHIRALNDFVKEYNIEWRILT